MSSPIKNLDGAGFQYQVKLEERSTLCTLIKADPWVVFAEGLPSPGSIDQLSTGYNEVYDEAHKQ